MRVHTDTLTYRDFFDAAEYVKQQTGGAVFFHGEETLPRHGSRSRRQAFDVKLAGDGTLTRRRVNYGTSQADRFDRPFSATWDQWGCLLAYLYRIDPTMLAGPYTSAENFHDVTDHRFDAILSGRGPSIIHA